ncbi:MAG: hypothetical protein EBZ48_12590 [Proteobacteria bacterium]|nr:hypothetical protein [Pseudomonadota bacterium]
MRKLLLVLLLLWVILPCSAQADGCQGAGWALQQAARLRGLQPKSPVRCLVLAQPEYLEGLTALIRRDLSEARLQKEERLFKLLGFIPIEYSYAKCLVRNYAHQAAAYYSAANKTLVIPDWIPADDAVLVHEFTHALQDQYFNLERLDPSSSVVSDRSLALGALIEGDAMLTEVEFLASQKKSQLAGVDEKYRPKDEADCVLPPALQELMQFQYEFGAYFVARIKKHRSIDQVFRKPPQTTAEIIHPERYRSQGSVQQMVKARIPPRDDGEHQGPASV